MQHASQRQRTRDWGQAARTVHLGLLCLALIGANALGQTKQPATKEKAHDKADVKAKAQPDSITGKSASPKTNAGQDN